MPPDLDCWFTVSEDGGMTDAVRGVRLVLPLTPSGNQSEAGHPIETQKRKDRYRAQAWGRACRQTPPKHVEDLPERVRIEATFYVEAERDDDNLHWGFKWICDTLKAKQRGKLRWRQNLYTAKGYLIDDDPAHLILARPVQRIDAARPRVEVRIQALGGKA